jgi:ABC-type transport system involved in cytochrome c biogenesis permease subunit
MALKLWGITVLGLYGISAFIYLLYFITQKQSLKQITSLVLGTAALLHFIDIIILTISFDRIPIVSVFEVLTTATFIFAVVYLVLEAFIKDKSMGVLIAPILLLFQCIAVAGIDTTPKALPPELSGISYRIHVVLMMLAYSGFAIAFIASAMHLLLAREIHRKRLGFFFSRIPSLELLDRLNSSAAGLGFAFATAGMLGGFLMAVQYWGNPMPLDPKFISFFLIWCLYCFHIFARLKLGWRGERSSWLSVIGFMCVIGTFLIVSLYLTKLHLYI